MSAELKAVIVNEAGEIEYLPQDYIDIVDTSLGTVSHEVEVVTVDDFRRRLRNSTSTTQSIVKPLVTPLLSNHPGSSSSGGPSLHIRSTPTLLRNSRTPLIRQQAGVSSNAISISNAGSTAGATTILAQVPTVIQQQQQQQQQAHHLHQQQQQPQQIQLISQNGNTIEFLPVVQQMGHPAVLPPASAQFLRAVDPLGGGGVEGTQLIVYNCGDGSQFDIIDQNDVQLRLCEVLQEGGDEDGGEQNTIYICEQGDEDDDEPTYVPEEEAYQVIHAMDELPILQDEDGNVYELEEVKPHPHMEVQYALPMPAVKRRKKSSAGAKGAGADSAGENVPAKAAKKPLNELRCLERDCAFSGINIAELRKHLSSVHGLVFDEEVIMFPSEKEFKYWRETYERERMVSFIFRGGTKKVSRDQAVTYLICHRSGHYKPTMKDQSLRKRKMKPQGSCKMNGYCTAGIKLLKSLESGGIRCEICHTHYGHPLDNGAIPHLRVNNVLRKIILKKFEDGMSFNQVVQYLHHNPDRLEGIRLLDRRAVRNIYDKYRKNPEKCFLELEAEDEPPTSPPAKGKDSASESEESPVPPAAPAPRKPIIKVEAGAEAPVITIEFEETKKQTTRSGRGSTESETEEPANEKEAETGDQGAEVNGEDSGVKGPGAQPKEVPEKSKKVPARGRPGPKRFKKNEDQEPATVQEQEVEQPPSPEQPETETPQRKKRGRKPKTRTTDAEAEETTTAAAVPAPAAEPDSSSSIRRSARERKPKLFADEEVSTPRLTRIKVEAPDPEEEATSAEEAPSPKKKRESPTKPVKKPAAAAAPPPPPSPGADEAPPTLEKVSPLNPATQDSGLEPPALSATVASKKSTEREKDPSPEAEQPKEKSDSSSKPKEDKPPRESNKSSKSKGDNGRSGSNYSQDVISDELKETIEKLLQHGEAGPTVLMYKTPGNANPEYGRKDSRIHKSDFILVIQTPIQRQLMQMFSDVVSVDGHKGRPKDLKLMWVLVLDEFREAIPVAWLITNVADERVISIFLRVLHSHTGDMSTNFVQAPNGSEYCNLWASIFKCSPKMILSDEETRREMRIEVAENFPDNPTRRRLNTLMNDLMTAFSPASFDETAQTMKAFLEKEHGKRGLQFWNLFRDHWLKRASEWDLVSRVCAPINTIYASDAFGKLKKFIAFKGTKILNSCIDPVLKIGYDKCFSRSKRIFKGDQKMLKVMEDMEIQHSWAVEMSPEDFEVKTTEPFTYSVKDPSKNSTYTVFDIQSPCRCKFVCPKCDVCLHRFMCTCVMSNSDRVMCSHVHFARLMSLKLAPPVPETTAETDEPAAESSLSSTAAGEGTSQTITTIIELTHPAQPSSIPPAAETTPTTSEDEEAAAVSSLLDISSTTDVEITTTSEEPPSVQVEPSEEEPPALEDEPPPTQEPSAPTDEPPAPTEEPPTSTEEPSAETSTEASANAND